MYVLFLFINNYCNSITIFFIDEKRIRATAMRKIIEFYQEVAWGSISSILDHVVLWWSPKALAVSHSRGAQHFKDWLHRFLQKHHGNIKNNF